MDSQSPGLERRLWGRMTAVTQFDLFGSKLGYGEPRHTERQGPAAQSRSPRTLSTLPYSAPPIPSSQRQLSTLRKRLIRRDDMFGRRAFYEGLSYGSGLAASSSARRSILGPLVNARLMAKRVDLGGRRLLDVGGSGATRARCRWHQYRASRHYDTNQSQQAGIVIWLPTTGCNRCAGTSVCGPRPKSRPAASRAAFWGEPVAAATCSAWPPVTPKETFLTSTPSKAQHRPMSARAPTHNVDCPGNSLHSGEPFAEGHTFEEQFEFVRNPGGHTRNNCKRIWSTSAIEPCGAQSCFNHPGSQRAN